MDIAARSVPLSLAQIILQPRLQERHRARMVDEGVDRHEGPALTFVAERDCRHIRIRQRADEEMRALSGIAIERIFPRPANLIARQRDGKLLG